VNKIDRDTKRHKEKVDGERISETERERGIIQEVN